jgi:hypothetical protein
VLASPEQNPWLVLLFEAVRKFVPDMPQPSPEVISSPFALAHRERVEELLGDAGYVDVRLEVFNCPTRMGQGDLNNCMAFVADFSNPVATALRRTEPHVASAVM